MKHGKIFVVSAPSGAGKTTLLEYARSAIPDLVYSISATTRPPRAHEIDGTHYFFLTTEEFKRRIDSNEFAEWQIVHNNYYGTPTRFIRETITGGKHIVMDIDVYGKKKFDLVFPDTVGILILPPSMDALEMRLRTRATDSDETIRLRIANARKEVAFAHDEGTYEYTLVNDDLEKAQAGLLNILRTEIAR